MKRLASSSSAASRRPIVLEDADFNTACLIGIGPLMHAGRAARRPTRMLLPRSRYDEGVGDPARASTRTSRPVILRTPAPIYQPRSFSQATISTSQPSEGGRGHVLTRGKTGRQRSTRGLRFAPTLAIDVDGKAGRSWRRCWAVWRHVIPDDQKRRTIHASPSGPVCTALPAM